MPDKVRVRIAPSPTGNLHLGTARTALYNYLYAHRHGGTFVMRLEDTDEVRSDESYTKDIFDGLRWLGLTWDEGPDIGGPFAPYRQTEKIDRYSHVANLLLEKGAAYFCFCSPQELEALKEEQKNTTRGPRYDNRCRSLTPQQKEKYVAEGRVPAIRFKIDEPRVISWHDGIKGEIAIDSSDLGGDMVIVKSNGVAIYNFAVVVDDIDMKMTYVIRGEDHIHNTAKQILIYEALGETTPSFAHPALIFDIERRKLSKRHHGELVHIDRYRQDGYMPEAMVNYLAQMSWSLPEDREIISLDEACRIFDLSKISKSPAVFDLPRLNWFNSHYLRDLPLTLVTDRAQPYLVEFSMEKYSRQQLEEIIACVRDGLTMLSELTEAVRFFFEDAVVIPEDVMNSVLSKESATKVLQAFYDQIPNLPFGDHAACKKAVDEIGKSLGLKGKDLYWPVRVAISGKTQGPDLGSIISILGKIRLSTRVDAAIQQCKQHA
jgi:glutamyl-tRNA synthetase